MILVASGFISYALILAIANQIVLSAIGQIAGIFGMLLFYYFSIINSKCSTNEIIRLYLKYAFIISLIAYVEVGSFLVGFERGYDLSWIIPKWDLYLSANGSLSVHSILPEPAHYIHVMVPAISISLFQFAMKSSEFQSNFKSIAILGTIPFNLSALSFLTIFLVGGFILVKKKRVYTMLLSAIFGSVLLVAYENIEPIQLRVDSVINLFAGNYQGYGNDENFSALTLYNHAQISWNRLRETSALGGGLKSHSIAYDKYSMINNANIEGWNRDDANSLIFRLISELGVLGLGFYIYLVYRISKPNITTNWDHAAIAVAIATYLLIYGLRQGHYFLFGLEFFILLGLRNFQEYRKMENRPTKKELTKLRAVNNINLDPSANRL